MAVLDSGAPSALFTVLVGNVDYGRVRNAITNPVSAADLYDSLGHGTEVSGVISAIAHNGEGITGASWNARILPIKVGNSTYISQQNVFRALDYLLTKGGCMPNSHSRSEWRDAFCAILRSVIGNNYPLYVG